MGIAKAPERAAPPSGLIIELVTPLDQAGGLDGESLARLVVRVLPAADGLLAGGPGLGEALDLPLATRRDLLSRLLPLIKGRVPLFFGIAGNSWEETRDLAAAVREHCRAVAYPGSVYLVDLPLWYHSNRGLPQACQRLWEDVGLPLILLNLPEVISRRSPLLKHRNLRTHVFKKLMAQPGIVGLIYQGEMRRFLNYHSAAAERPGFAFYEADEGNFLTQPGAWGVVSAGAQILPQSWRQVVRACLHPEEMTDDREHRLMLWGLSRQLLEMARIYQGAPAALLKAALAAQGVLKTARLAPGTSAASESLSASLQDLVGAIVH